MSDEPFNVIISRIDGWKTFIKGLINFYTEIAESHHKLSLSLTKCANIEFLPSKRNLWTHSSTQISSITQNLSKLPLKLGLDHELVYSHITQNILSTLKTTRQDLKKQKQKYIQETKKRREYQSSFISQIEKLKTEFNASLNTCLKKDSYLIKLEILLFEKKNINEYRKRLNENISYFIEYEKMESNSHESVTSIITRFCDWAKDSIINHHVLESLRKSVDDFVLETNIIDIRKQLTMLSPEPIHEIGLDNLDSDRVQILKYGQLIIQKASGWKQMSCIVTACGYFHIFPKQIEFLRVGSKIEEFFTFDEFLKMKIVSIRLNSSQIVHLGLTNQKHPEDFDIIEENPGYFSSSFKVCKVRGKSIQDTQEWLQVLGGFGKSKQKSMVKNGMDDDNETLCE